MLGTKGGLVDGITPEQPFAAGLLSAGISLLGVTVPKSSQPFAEIVDGYKTQCSSADGANVLQATAVGGAPTPHPSPDPTWGLHLLDVGLTWGTMVKVVGIQGQTWLAASPSPRRTTSCTSTPRRLLASWVWVDAVAREAACFRVPHDTRFGSAVASRIVRGLMWLP